MAFRVCDESLVSEVVCEREGLDEFFETTKLPGVSIAVDGFKFGNNSLEASRDIG